MMKRLCLCLLLATILPFASVAQQTKTGAAKKTGTTVKKTSFKPGCDSPTFPADKKTPADSFCGISGSGGAEANQNKAKNDFCSSGDAESVDFDKLKSLQDQVASATGIDWGNKNTDNHKKGPTQDRAPLESMGEGKLVVLKGFVLIARQEGAESVNCGKNAPNSPPYHDIHISIVQSADETDECSSVVAETSPHHRPPEWNAANLNAVGKAHLPVRITGHLFFDSSHVPCADGKPVPSNPKRVSLWEVHPVYEFEVCTANCDAEGTWAKLEDWAKTHSKSSSSGRKKSSSGGHKKSS